MRKYRPFVDALANASNRPFAGDPGSPEQRTKCVGKPSKELWNDLRKERVVHFDTPYRIDATRPCPTACRRDLPGFRQQCPICLEGICSAGRATSRQHARADITSIRAQAVPKADAAFLVEIAVGGAFNHA
jgi:hypothetical protein